jgi:hypothetical protein
MPTAKHRSRTAGEGDKPQDSRARHRGVGQRQGTDESFEQDASVDAFASLEDVPLKSQRLKRNLH